MELKTHDLIWINSDCNLLRSPMPEWAVASLARSPVVVVRRANAPLGWLPVGIRGRNRHERHGTMLRESDVSSYRTPESLAVEQAWNRSSHSIGGAALHSLRLIADVAASQAISWGVVGSVGYELATGFPVTRENSDIDIIIRVVEIPALSSLHKFYRKLSMASCRVDALIETPTGAVSLEEFIRGPERLLIRTDSGVHLGALDHQQ